MNLTEFLEFAKTTAVYHGIGNNWKYPLIGLGGEVGEVMNILKKSIRDDYDVITIERQEALVKELGDVVWYFVMLCFELGINPDHVLQKNVEKLKQRLKENTVHDRGNRHEPK